MGYGHGPTTFKPVCRNRLFAETPTLAGFPTPDRRTSSRAGACSNEEPSIVLDGASFRPISPAWVQTPRKFRRRPTAPWTHWPAVLHRPAGRRAASSPGRVYGGRSDRIRGLNPRFPNPRSRPDDPRRKPIFLGPLGIDPRRPRVYDTLAPGRFRIAAGKGRSTGRLFRLRGFPLDPDLESKPLGNAEA